MQVQPFLDLDGVLADFDELRDRYFGELYKDATHKFYDSKYDDYMWDQIKEKYPNWFMDIKPMPDMNVLLDFIWPYKPIVLTALVNPKRGSDLMNRTIRQKQEWVHRYLGNIPTIICLRSHKKDYAVAPGAVLIDDNPNNVEEFVTSGGSGILHTSATNTVEEFNKLIASTR